MKKIFTLSVLFLLVVTFTNCDNNSSSVSRSTEEIEVIIDSGTPQYYSNNIIATDYPATPASGFNCEFKITSDDGVSNIFNMNFGQQVDPCPFTATTPYSNTITGPVSYLLTIPGITFDDTAANSINFNITNFGSNTGDDIDITLNGTYYEVSDPNPHTIDISIHVHRD